MDKHSSDRHRWQETRMGINWPPEWTPKRNYQFRRFEGPFVGIPTRIFEKALLFGFTKREISVFFALCRKTYGWGKDKDKVSYSQIAKLTGLHETHVGMMMRNMRTACVLTCEGNPVAGKPLVWSVQENTAFWDLEKLKRLRVATRRSKTASDAGNLPTAEMAVPATAKTALPPRAKMAVPTQSQNGSTQKKQLEKDLKKDLKKTIAANAALSSSQSQEEEKGKGGLLGNANSSETTDPSTQPTISIIPTKDEQIYILKLCSQLEAGGKDPYEWLGKRRREGVPVEGLTRVLEKAVKERDQIGEFGSWADNTFESIRENKSDGQAGCEQEIAARSRDGSVLSDGEVSK